MSDQSSIYKAGSFPQGESTMSIIVTNSMRMALIDLVSKEMASGTIAGDAAQAERRQLYSQLLKALQSPGACLNDIANITTRALRPCAPQKR